MGVREAGRDLDLTEKPLRTQGSRDFGLQDLDGDSAMVLQVLGEIDVRHLLRQHAVQRALTVQARDLRSRSTTRAAARSECRAPEAQEKSIVSQGSHARRSRRGTVR